MYNTEWFILLFTSSLLIYLADENKIHSFTKRKQAKITKYNSQKKKDKQRSTKHYTGN